MNREQFLNQPSLREDLENSLRAGLASVLEGAQTDLQAFAHEISGDMVIAASSGDDDALEELRAQVRALAEANRLRAVNATWKIAGDVVVGLTSFLITTATRLG
jgi:hypothetical protein